MAYAQERNKRLRGREQILPGPDWMKLRDYEAEDKGRYGKYETESE